MARARRLVTGHGVRGFKFHPSLQAFEPNGVRFYPLYEALQELGVPALFHTGQTGIRAGLPGGRGIKLRYSAPMLLDDVAPDFPHLTVVLAPLGAVAGRGDLHRHSQGQRLHRPLGMVAEVLPAAARAGGEHDAQAQGAVRVRLPGHHPPTAGSRTSRSSR